MSKPITIKEIIKKPIADVEITYNGIQVRLYKKEVSGETKNLAQEFTLKQARELAAAINSKIAEKRK